MMPIPRRQECDLSPSLSRPTRASGDTRIQTLGRRYCARCRAIRLAQARISKYIDSNTQLPYWVNPATGVTTWSKPKVFGAADVEHAMMVATSKTEHLVRRERQTRRRSRLGVRPECMHVWT